MFLQCYHQAPDYIVIILKKRTIKILGQSLQRWGLCSLECIYLYIDLLFSFLKGEGQEALGQKLMLKKFLLNMNFVTVWMTAQKQIANWGCGVSLIGDIQDTLLCHMFWFDPARAGRLDQRTLCGPFQLDPFCDSELQKEKEAEKGKWRGRRKGKKEKYTT